MKARLAALGVDPMSKTPAEFEKFIADETEKWGKVILAANIKVESIMTATASAWRRCASRCAS